jgi:hypothetical protein
MYDNWETYPHGVDVYTPLGKDRTVCSRDLSTASGRLFQMVGGGVDIVWQEDGGKLVHERTFLSEEMEQCSFLGVSKIIQLLRKSH